MLEWHLSILNIDDAVYQSIFNTRWLVQFLYAKIGNKMEYASVG